MVPTCNSSANAFPICLLLSVWKANFQFIAPAEVHCELCQPVGMQRCDRSCVQWLPQCCSAVQYVFVDFSSEFQVMNY